MPKLDKTVQLLEAAKAKIVEPNNWTTGAMARDSNGKVVFSNDSSAIKFDAVGALLCATHEDMDKHGTHLAHHEIGILLDQAVEKSIPLFEQPHISIGEFNDTHSHERVIELFDIAIGLAKGEPLWP